MVAMYKKLRSINALKNNVINALHTKTIRSTGGNVSLLAISTANNVGMLDKCRRMMLTQPSV
jgi:hypothetical protein